MEIDVCDINLGAIGTEIFLGIISTEISDIETKSLTEIWSMIEM